MDLGAIRTALASQIAALTGLRAEGEIRDQISPPVALVVPAPQLVTYGVTMGDVGATELRLKVMIVISDASTVERTQRALDSYLGVGAGETMSVPAAIMQDPTLGGVCGWCLPLSAGSYGRLSIAGQDYFGSSVEVSVGA